MNKGKGMGNGSLSNNYTILERHQRAQCGEKDSQREGQKARSCRKPVLKACAREGYFSPLSQQSARSQLAAMNGEAKQLKCERSKSFWYGSFIHCTCGMHTWIVVGVAGFCRKKNLFQRQAQTEVVYSQQCAWVLRSSWRYPEDYSSDGVSFMCITNYGINDGYNYRWTEDQVVLCMKMEKCRSMKLYTSALINSNSELMKLVKKSKKKKCQQMKW